MFVLMQRQLEHPFIHSLHDCWQTQRHLFISELSPNPSPQLQPYSEASLVEMSPVLSEVIQKIATAPGRATPAPPPHRQANRCGSISLLGLLTQSPP